MRVNGRLPTRRKPVAQQEEPTRSVMLHRVLRYFAGICIACLLSGCERAMHNMYVQPKYKPGASSPLFSNGNASRPPPDGSIPAAEGELAGPSSGRLGRSAAPPTATPTGGNPYPMTMTLLKRGRNRYDIYCATCHGLAGEGNGMIVQRGFPKPLPYTDARLLHATDADLQRSIRNGYGVMYPFANRVNARDSWAIVAYIRALQLSQRANVAQLAARDVKALGIAGAQTP